MGTVRSVNVGRVAEFRAGRAQRSAIVKAPVAGRVAVGTVNLAGDEQAERRHHGGPDQAVYAYARESYDWWQAELGRELPDGFFGENLTLEGVDADHALVGETWAVGTAVLPVTAPRIPCLKLQTRIGEPRFVRRFAAARRPGAYLRVLWEGELAAGDAVEVLDRPAHAVTIADVHEVFLYAQDDAARLLPARDLLAERARSWLDERLAAR